MANQITLQGLTNKPYVPTSTYEDEPLYALLTISSQAQDDFNPFGGGSNRAPLNLVLVVDASATMYNFQLSQEERDYWLNLALSRGEMERGEADERDAVYWSGQTLAEMQVIVHKPMTLAVDAIRKLMDKLEVSDSLSLLAFADQNYNVFSASDWHNRPDYCRAALDDLLDQRLPYDIGTGTRMAAALRQANGMLRDNGTMGATERIVIISDGIVQDRRETFEAIEAVRADQHAVSTIGLGEEFDEEFLMRVASVCHGEYHYAATSDEIESKLMSELTTMQATTLHQVNLAAEGLSGAMVQDVYMVSPSMTIFDEMDAGAGVLRARIGDLPADRNTLLLLQIAPPLMPTGEYPLASVTLTWHEATGVNAPEQQTTVQIKERFIDDPALLAQVNEYVQDYVDRFKVYRYEREAQRAEERGDIESAREKLGAATRELQRLGETDLAADLQQQIASMGTGMNDPSRVKRIKATTRKLGEKVTPGI